MAQRKAAATPALDWICLTTTHVFQDTLAVATPVCQHWSYHSAAPIHQYDHSNIATYV